LLRVLLDALLRVSGLAAGADADADAGRPSRRLFCIVLIFDAPD
jgi:hypothetical protein